MKRMVGKTVMVTGATSGMGRASAIMFAQEGAEVILIGRDEQRGNEVVAKIEEMGEKAKLYLCDISIEKNVEELYQVISESYEKIDVLFNNAGIWTTFCCKK